MTRQRATREQIEAIFARDPLVVLDALVADGEVLVGVAASPATNGEPIIELWGAREDLDRLDDVVVVVVDGAELEVVIEKHPLSVRIGPLEKRVASG